MDTLPPSTLSRVKFGKSLSGMTGREGIVVDFEDGSSEGPFDLVVGCDGVNSAVKEYIETGNIPKVGRKSNQALYSGIRIQYAVQELEATKDVDTFAKLRQYFGNGAYALSGVYGSGKNRAPMKCAFTISLDDNYIGPFRKKEARRSTGVTDENADWSQDNRKGTSETMLEKIAECGVPDIEVGPIIRQASRFFELGVYLHNPISFKGWSKQVEGSGGRFCTLGGDAAHAMPPFLGQGSNQAIQDSYCLAKKIFEYNAALSTGDQVALQAVLKSYESIRWKPTTSISVKAAVLGYLEASTGPIAKFRDVFFRTLGSIGVAKKVYLGAAVPVVSDDEKEDE
jgi:salicylate hydroxylase